MDIELLVTHSTSGVSQHFRGPLADRILLGRDSASPIHFQGGNISRRHLDLLTRAGRIVVEDLSTNGTWVNGRRTAKGVENEIHNGDLIEIPEYRIEIRLPGEVPSTASSHRPLMPSEPPPRTLWSVFARRLGAWFDPLEGMALLGSIGSLAIILVYLVS